MDERLEYSIQLAMLRQLLIEKLIDKRVDWQPFFGQIYTEHKTSFITPV